MSDDPAPKWRGIIGRDRFLMEKLAGEIRGDLRTRYDYTALRDLPRGYWFEVRMVDGYVARVTVELDRVEAPTPPPASGR